MNKVFLCLMLFLVTCTSVYAAPGRFVDEESMHTSSSFSRKIILDERDKILPPISHSSLKKASQILRVASFWAMAVTFFYLLPETNAGIYPKCGTPEAEGRSPIRWWNLEMQDFCDTFLRSNGRSLCFACED